MRLTNSLIFVEQSFTAPTPTTFSAATDTLSQLEGGFEGGSKVWLQVMSAPSLHRDTTKHSDKSMSTKVTYLYGTPGAVDEQKFL